MGELKEAVDTVERNHLKSCEKSVNQMVWDTYWITKISSYSKSKRFTFTLETIAQGRHASSGDTVSKMAFGGKYASGY